MTMTDLLEHIVIIGRAHGAGDGLFITQLEEKIKLSSDAVLPSAACDLLHFIPNAQQLEDSLMEKEQSWWCVVFVNVSTESAQRLSVEFVQQEILPVVTELQRARQDSSMNQLTAHVAITDLCDASSYFELYPFSLLFTSDTTVGSLGRLDALERVERMVRNGQMIHGSRVNLEDPVVLLFRPGSAAYLREGRKWSANQLAKQQGPPLRMMVRMKQMMRFISEMPEKTSAARGTLVQRLLLDYKETTTNALHPRNGIDERDPSPEILTEEDSRQHQRHVLDALRTMRERWQMLPEKRVHSIDGFNGMTTQQRVDELLKRLKKQSESDTDMGEDSATTTSHKGTKIEAAETTEASETAADVEALEDLRLDL